MKVIVNSLGRQPVYSAVANTATQKAIRKDNRNIAGAPQVGTLLNASNTPKAPVKAVTSTMARTNQRYV